MMYVRRLRSALYGTCLRTVSHWNYNRGDPWPRTEIVAYAREINADLLVMGAHGHRRLKDLIFGTTIDPVRHALKVPILVVREER